MTGQVMSNKASIHNRLLAKLGFRHLQAVVLTAELGSTHRAAEMANISQPSIAKFLAMAESVVGEPLFERHSRGMRQTSTCKTLLPIFQAMLLLVQRGAKTLDAVQSGKAGTIHIEALPAACNGSIVRGIAQYCRRFQQFQLHLEENDQDHLHELLMSRVYDAVLTRTPTIGHSPLKFEPLEDDHSVVLARKGHRLSHRRALSLDVLGDEQWLILPLQSTSRIIFESWFSSGVPYPVVSNVSTSSLSAITGLVAYSDALIVLPASFAGPALMSGSVCALDVQRQESLRPLGILWNPAAVTTATSTFCDWMTAGTWRDSP